MECVRDFGKYIGPVYVLTSLISEGRHFGTSSFPLYLVYDYASLLQRRVNERGLDVTIASIDYLDRSCPFFESYEVNGVTFLRSSCDLSGMKDLTNLIFDQAGIYDLMKQTAGEVVARYTASP